MKIISRQGEVLFTPACTVGSMRACLELAVRCEANLNSAYLHYLNLSGADLQWADFTGADFSKAKLDGANLPGATLNGADLRFASFCGSNLMQTSFYDADLRGLISNLQTSLVPILEAL